jgi:hypothetical protein
MCYIAIIYLVFNIYWLTGITFMYFTRTIYCMYYYILL